ncbi:bacA [Symbiodinium natans]|uniref:BacA protein n=1 Tax=Symbiodinium natans TaxID=878477 RepID=A0A812USC1_9DINO|nr:bacA [Symbiodinium natans]
MNEIMTRKMEIRQGPERRAHDIEAGSMVLAAFRDPGHSQPTLLSWRVGEGAVPGYIEVAVASMRLCESADFKAPEAVQTCRPTGPSYEGQTPLRRLEVADLCPLLDELLADDEASTPAEPDGGSPSNKPYQLPADWVVQGQPTAWADLKLVENGSFRLALLATTEAIDLCLLEEEGQLHFLELERAHGNALAREGRYEEASEAYKRALDAVRRSPMYKALFPTERGHIQGAYSREASEGENPLQGLSEEEVSTRRSNLVALHLNLSLCGNKARATVGNDWGCR